MCRESVLQRLVEPNHGCHVAFLVCRARSKEQLLYARDKLVKMRWNMSCANGQNKPIHTNFQCFQVLKIVCVFFPDYVVCSSFMGHAISIRSGPPVLNFFGPLFLQRGRGVQAPLGGQPIWAVKISFPVMNISMNISLGCFKGRPGETNLFSGSQWVQVDQGGWEAESMPRLASGSWKSWSCKLCKAQAGHLTTSPGKPKVV